MDDESRPGIENEPEYILAHNLEMMGRPFTEELGGESMGGNAGTYNYEGKTYPCSAVNGYYDTENGKIVTFGNFQDVSPDIRKNNGIFTFKVIHILHLTVRPIKVEVIIVEIIYQDQPSKKAKEILEKTVTEFHSQHKK